MEGRAARLREDLQDTLQELSRLEAKTLSELDEDLIERGVYGSGFGIQRHREIREEFARKRRRAIRQWQDSTEDLGLPTPNLPETDD